MQKMPPSLRCTSSLEPGPGRYAGVRGQGGSPSVFKILTFCLSWIFCIIIVFRDCIIIFILIPEFLWRPFSAACRECLARLPLGWGGFQRWSFGW